MKLTDMPTAREVLKRNLADPAFRAAWSGRQWPAPSQTVFGVDRAEHGLSQSALARQLGMSQPAIARLELGEHEPTFTTLTRLSHGLGIAFHIDIEDGSLSLSA